MTTHVRATLAAATTGALVGAASTKHGETTSLKTRSCPRKSRGQDRAYITSSQTDPRSLPFPKPRQNPERTSVPHRRCHTPPPVPAAPNLHQTRSASRNPVNAPPASTSTVCRTFSARSTRAIKSHCYGATAPDTWDAGCAIRWRGSRRSRRPRRQHVASIFAWAYSYLTQWNGPWLCDAPTNLRPPLQSGAIAQLHWIGGTTPSFSASMRS